MLDNKKVKIYLGLLIIGIFLIILIVVGFFYFYPGVGKVPNNKLRIDYLVRSKNFNGKQFFNIDTNYKLFTEKKNKKESKVEDTIPLKKIPVIKSENIRQGKKEELLVTWLGHSSILVQLGEKNILIDPVLTKYVSPVNFIGIKRFSDIPIEPENLPKIDVLLLSHDHYDHLDYQTIKKIDKKVKNYIVPLGIESILMNWGIAKEKIYTVAWWERIKLENIDFLFTPSQHFSGRNPLKNNSTLWGGYYFKNEFYSIYYSGDGGYNSDIIKAIKEKTDKIDLALLECGQYSEEWAMTHMFPEETAMTAKEIDAAWFIPVHWGAFKLSDNSWNDSVKRVYKVAEELKLNKAVPMIGETINYTNIDKYQKKWWEE